jgi:toxin ParE1/3/4
MKIEISAAARYDLIALFTDGVQRFGLRQAEAFRNDLDRKFRLIASHPQIGPPWEEGSRFRKVTHFPYVVLYTAHADHIRIERIIDGRSDYPFQE